VSDVVQKIKHEKRCKICASPHADAIDALLLKRSKREKDAEGKTVNLDYVLAAMTEYGIENPTLDNVKGHWKNHRQVVSEEEVAEQTERLNEAIQQLESGEFEFEDVDEGLRFFFSVGMKDLKRKVAAGELSGITHDHLLKAAGEITKRRQNDAQQELLRALGGGIQQVFTKALGGGEQQPQIEQGEVIDAEVVEVEEGSAS
jgi:hypothetical protein